MIDKTDWYPTTLAGERDLYKNLDAKIDGYKTKYPFITDDYAKAIRACCAAFIEVYDKTIEIRATGKQLTAYLTNLMNNPAKGTPAPAPPVFANISLPANATVGIEAQIRDFAGLLKGQGNYDAADGNDLMVERSAISAPDLAAFVPDIKVGLNQSGAVTVEWKKSGFDSLELQYRVAGTTMWQAADKSTEKIVVFTPPLTTPGVPQKFEFRAVCLIKNKRVGEWSAIHIVTVG